MRDAQNDPVDPPQGYPVTLVAGHEPAALDDFVGATTLTVRGADGENELVGSGLRDGAAVQFRERQPSSAADDAPVWEIVDGDASFAVRPSSDS